MGRTTYKLLSQFLFINQWQGEGQAGESEVSRACSCPSRPVFSGTMYAARAPDRSAGSICSSCCHLRGPAVQGFYGIDPQIENLAHR